MEPYLIAAVGITCTFIGLIAGRLNNGASYWQRLYIKAELARMNLQERENRRMAPLFKANAQRKAASKALRDDNHARMRAGLGKSA